MKLLAFTIVLAIVSTARVGCAEIPPDPAVLAAQQDRVETIQRICPPTICIIDSAGQSGGSGVVISADGYALTNFHVTAPCGPALKCGMTDGRMYDAVIVGIDPTGDVALIKLLGRDDFPAAQMGNSDDVRVGQWAFVVGNPFMLADDFQPTVSYGIISGVHRYQYPAGTLLEYADCIQTDAAINPGNSGGPLFDSDGRLIGINGRGSFEKRGRVNVGVGYAISINQIKRFLGYLKSGRIVDHASLAATVTTDAEGRVVVDEILPDSDAFRRGLRYDDEIVRFGDREISSVNGFKNALGTYPRNWRVPLIYRRDGQQFECLVRLTGLHREGELMELVSGGGGLPRKERPEQPQPGHPDQPELPISAGEHATQMPPVVGEHYEARPGYANYWFNQYHQQRVWNSYLTRGDFAETGLNWTIRALVETGGDVLIELSEEQGTITQPIGVSSADFTRPVGGAPSPPQSGGLLHALHHWQRLLVLGPARFGDLYYLGTVPWPGQSELVDCLVGSYGGSESRLYFNPETGDLIGIEFFAGEDADPCEILLSDIREQMGRHLPYRWEIRHGDNVYAVFEITSYDLNGGQ